MLLLYFPGPPGPSGVPGDVVVGGDRGGSGVSKLFHHVSICNIFRYFCRSDSFENMNNLIIFNCKIQHICKIFFRL